MARRHCRVNLNVQVLHWNFILVWTEVSPKGSYLLIWPAANITINHSSTVISNSVSAHLCQQLLYKYFVCFGYFCLQEEITLCLMDWPDFSFIPPFRATSVADSSHTHCDYMSLAGIQWAPLIMKMLTKDILWTSACVIGLLMIKGLDFESQCAVGDPSH